MKVLILILLPFLVNLGAYAQGSSLQYVADELRIASEDFEVGYFFSFNVKDLEQAGCQRSNPSEVLELFEEAKDEYVAHYGDENLPWEKAEGEILELIQGHELELCQREVDFYGDVESEYILKDANSKQGLFKFSKVHYSY